MSYSTREVRAFVRAEFREAQQHVIQRLHELARLRSERRAFFFRLGTNPGQSTHVGKTLRVIYQRDQWLKVRPANPRIWCECGRIFHNENQKNAHRWHCRKNPGIPRDLRA